MKKQLSVLFFLLALVFVSFSYSTNALAIENDMSYKNGQVISVSDSLDEASSTNAVEDDMSYKNGQVISVSDSLDEAYLTYITENNTDNLIDPLGAYLYKDKTVNVFFEDYTGVTETHYYTEYIGGYWYRGFLNLTKVVKVTNGWSATYSGKIATYIE